MLTPRNYEPTEITAGDTLTFQRSIGKYPASAGWQLTYELRGRAQAIEFTSVASGDSHVITVPAATTASWLPGAYELEGYAGNIATGERERIFINNLTINRNLEGAAGDISVTTHAQRMIALIEAVQEGKATHDLLESEVEGTRIKRLSPKELREEYNYWKQMRQNEVRAADSLAGRSSGRNRFAVFTDPNGASIGQFGALPPIFPGEHL
jgi:hypothetical protein